MSGMTAEAVSGRMARQAAQRKASEQAVVAALRARGESFTTTLEANTGLRRDAVAKALKRLHARDEVVVRPVKQFGTPPKLAYRLPDQPRLLRDGHAGTNHRTRRRLADGQQPIRDAIAAAINANLPHGRTRDQIINDLDGRFPANEVRQQIIKMWDTSLISYRLDGSYITNGTMREVGPGA